MSYFSKDSTAFLKKLAKNNNRDLFKANKGDYEQYLKEPAEVFAEMMTARLEKLTGLQHKSKIFRIYRDVRFSKDKTPYNIHLRISFVPQDGPKTSPGWFFSLEKDHLVLGAGVFGYEKAELENFRERVAGDDGVLLAKILSKLESGGARISDPALKRVPSGFDANHPRADLLRHKGLAVWIDKPDADLALGEKAAANCLKELRRVKPLVDWLMQE